MAAPIDYANLSTPPACVADFCLIPVSFGLPGTAGMHLGFSNDTADWHYNSFSIE
jgi:hypothetical protein